MKVVPVTDIKVGDVILWNNLEYTISKVYKLPKDVVGFEFKTNKVFSLSDFVIVPKSKSEIEGLNDTV